MRIINYLLPNKIILLILFLLCLICYFPTFNADYLYLDDLDIILENNLIKQPFNFNSFINILTSFQDNQYTPLSNITFWLEYNLFLDFNSSFSHCINFLIHIFGVVALYYFLLEFLKDRKYATVVSIIWAIHPIQTASVVWLTGRRTLLYGSMFIGSLYFYTKYINTKINSYKILALFAMLFSGLSKTLAFTAPIVWLGIDIVNKRNFNYKLLLDKLWAFSLSLIFIMVMFLSANSGIQKDTNKTVQFNIKQAFFSLGYYPVQTVFPHNLSAINELNNKTQVILDKTFIYFSVFLVLTTIISFKSNIALFGLFFYLIHIIPLSGFIRVGYPFYASYHYCYIPILGILLILLEGIKQLILKNNIISNKKLLTLAILALLFLGFRTYSFSTVYNNNENLFTNSLIIDPYNRIARIGLINYYVTYNNFDKAEYHCRNIELLYPNFYLGYLLHGKMEIQRQDYKKALLLLEKALEIKPDQGRIYWFLGYSYFKINSWQQAENELSKYLLSDSNSSMAYYYRSLVRQKQGKYLLADEDYKQLALIEPISFDNKIHWFFNSMQMINYYQSVLKAVDIYAYIKVSLNDIIGIEDFYAELFKPSFDKFLFQCLPYYSYLERIYNKFFKFFGL